MITRVHAHHVILSLASILAGIQSGCQQSPLFVRTETLAVPQVAGAALEAVTTNGEIEARQSGLSDVQIAATIRAESDARAQATKIVAQRRADQTLVVGVQWPDGQPLPREGCDFQILLPAASGVMLRTDNGRLATSGLSGPANLQTSNGAIDVSGHHGAVTAVTSNGQIKIAGATAARAPKPRTARSWLPSPPTHQGPSNCARPRA